MGHVSQIGFDGAAAFASAMLELAAGAPDIGGALCLMSLTT
jgi:hypothetical protein